jgi:DNA-binding XRE family transcriptional regulator
MAATARKLKKKAGRSDLKVLKGAHLHLKVSRKEWSKAQRIAIRDAIYGSRIAQGMTQQELADKAGVAHTTVVSLENMETKQVYRVKRSPMFRTFHCIVVALGMDVSI